MATDKVLNEDQFVKIALNPEDIRPEDVFFERELVHSGSQTFYRLVSERASQFQAATTTDQEKHDIAMSIVRAIRNQNGRFLQRKKVRGQVDEEYYSIGDQLACKMTFQVVGICLATEEVVHADDIRPEDVIVLLGEHIRASLPNSEIFAFSASASLLDGHSGNHAFLRLVTDYLDGHNGNHAFLRLVTDYLLLQYRERRAILKIVGAIRKQNGRFLEKDAFGIYRKMGDSGAAEVAGQIFRSEQRKQMPSGVKGAWRKLPETKRLEKSAILDILRSAPILLPKSDLEDRFTEDLRLDRDVVLAFCQRPDLSRLCSERGFTVPDCYTSDKSIMLEYCGKVPGSLERCSRELRADREIVLKAVRHDGMNLRLASLDLVRDDEELVRIACRSNARALECCLPGSVLHSMLNDRVFMVEMLEGTPDACEMLYRHAPEDLKQDPHFVESALKAGLSLREVPPHFYMSAIGTDAARHWSSLPQECQADKGFIRQALLKSPNLPLQSEFESKFTDELLMDPDICQAFDQRNDLADMRRLEFDLRSAPYVTPEPALGDVSTRLCSVITRMFGNCYKSIFRMVKKSKNVP